MAKIDKPWWVFGFEHYYPCGGMNDFIGCFATKEEAHKITEGVMLGTPAHRYLSRCSEYDVIDIRTLKPQKPDRYGMAWTWDE